jgi:hypothetical protein
MRADCLESVSYCGPGPADGCDCDCVWLEFASIRLLFNFLSTACRMNDESLIILNYEFVWDSNIYY